MGPIRRFRTGVLRGALATGLTVLLLDGGGCAEPSGPTGAPLTLRVHGRLERGGVVALSAAQEGRELEQVEWKSEPPGSVEWLDGARARFLSTGPVRLLGTLGDVRGTLQLDVRPPPTVAFERIAEGRRNIWMVSLDGGELRDLDPDPAEERWPSSQGGRVYFVGYRVAPAAVFAVGGTGGPASRVTSVEGSYEQVAISPDGTSMAFVRPVDGSARLFVSDRSGGSARRLDTHPLAIESGPAWSPDGLRLAYTSTARGNADIWVVPPSGGAPTVAVVGPASEVEPTWSPDGKQIAFVRSPAPTVNRLVIVELATGAETVVTAAGESVSGPEWLADGRIVFAAGSGTERRLTWLDPTSIEPARPVPGPILLAGTITPVR